MPVDPKLGEIERTDHPNEGQVGTLEKVVSILRHAHSRLAAIQAGQQAPPEPDKAATVAALDGIKAEAARVTAIAEELARRLR